MTQEQKDLLLRDLCSRLPYGVKINYNDKVYNFSGIHSSNMCVLSDNEDNAFTIPGIKYIKPYLFPLSSMTEEQKNSFPFSYSFLEALIDGGVYFDEDECITLNDMILVIQWCYKNHFDIHGLIPMGLAIDATGKNIY